MDTVNSYVRDGDRVFSETGSTVKVKYSPRIDDRGVLVLVETGKEDLSAYINSFAEECDIHVIMKKFANGQTDVLSKVQGTYGDFTGAPTSLADMFNRVKAGEEVFNSLPAEVKKEFGNSFTEFAVATGEKDFLARLAKYDTSATQSEVKEEKGETKEEKGETVE